MNNPPVNFKSTNKNFKFTANIAYSSTCRPNITNPLLKRRPKCKQIANGISTLSQQALRKMGTTITFGSIGQKEKHHWIHYISHTIKSILKLKILKDKDDQKFSTNHFTSIKIINSNHRFNGIKSIESRSHTEDFKPNKHSIFTSSSQLWLLKNSILTSKWWISLQ